MKSINKNKNLHPIIRRYHYGRMSKGTDLIKEMDHIISKVSRNLSIQMHDYQDDIPIRSVSQPKIYNKKIYSKHIMKKIINNQTWNNLIDTNYNNSANKSQISSKSLMQRNQSAPIQQISLPNLKMNQSLYTSINKMNKKVFNMIQYFSTSPKKKICRDIREVNNCSTKKLSLKLINDYKTRQLKWQNRHLPRYEEILQQESQR